MGIEGYKRLKYPTPESLQGKYDGYALIIGTGSSTAKLLNYKSEIKKHFNVVIGLNFATKDFEDIMDFHIIMEKNPVVMAAEMSLNYRKDLIRVLNYKSIGLFPKDMNIIKARRDQFQDTFSITSYRSKYYEGLLEKRKPGRLLYYGTVMLQALHFACILGCKNIYLIGADLMFKDEFDHYYKDRFYRDPVTAPESRSPLSNVIVNGETFQTTYVFKKSAKYIDKAIIGQCRTRGIEVYDFSDGLIKQAVKLDVDSFFKGK